ncbi:MAG: 50S ribosomal protein L27 [Candidatus Omnitrophica bacterium]|nr:50S ribosomal protein L27 [Candidatus Omnitrophota bacterium]
MSRRGGLSAVFYRETRGVKVSGGQQVKSGTILTREGHKWQKGLNVNGSSSLVAGIDGEVYFTRKKNSYNKIITVVNVKPSETAPVKAEKPVKAVKTVKTVKAAK